MARYAMLIAQAGDNYSAHVPDIPGVVATGATSEAVTRELHVALEFRLEGSALAGEPARMPQSLAGEVDVLMG